MYDIAVVGLGIAGASTLWRGAERGLRMVGFDLGTPPHALGSSHGRTRIVRRSAYEGQSYVEPARRSLRLWHELDAGAAQRVWFHTGLLLLGERDSPLLTSALDQAKEFDIAMDVVDLAESYPWLRNGTAGVLERNAGLVSPENAITAMLDRARALGAAVETECEITDIEPVDGSVRLRARDGVHHARKVVVATGAQETGVPLQLDQLVVPWFWGAQPLSFPPFIHELPDGRRFGGMPNLDADTPAKVMPMRPYPGETALADGVRDAEWYVRTHRSDLDPKAESAFQCLAPTTADGHFHLRPGERDVVHLAGLNGHGFKFGPVLGEAAVRMALEESVSWP
ncbi:FAD-dependent oxidoreductase [Amycolatopsis jejuensis]|uniref:FAD-dependent oxidoreductase n=1 Tax=Amycolatopsis jejuensis TaxID=330084 RepID=UPI000A72D880|nr:FAD-dependent oxidoreductase [Amycolatopsis jejuensis]